MLYRLSYVGSSLHFPPSSTIVLLHPGSSTPIRATCANLERVIGLEPTSSAWKAEVLPLNYTRKLVEGAGFEPAKA